MYQLIPLVKEIVTYNTFLKIRKEDSENIIKNLDILLENSDVDLKYEEVQNYINFQLTSVHRNKLEIFFFKISSIANDSYIRNSKSKK